MQTLETERLILRDFREDDLDDFYEYASNPHVGPAAGWPTHTSPEESAKILKRFIEEGHTFAIVIKQTGKVVGSLGLDPPQFRSREGAVDFGYALAYDCWGRGYMTEAVTAALKYAFEGLGLEIVGIGHFPQNDRSRRVIEKCGFVCEGCHRRAFKLPDGSFTDEVCYSMTRDEYRAIYG